MPSSDVPDYRSPVKLLHPPGLDDFTACRDDTPNPLRPEHDRVRCGSFHCSIPTRRPAMSQILSRTPTFLPTTEYPKMLYKGEKFQEAEALSLALKERRIESVIVINEQEETAKREQGFGTLVSLLSRPILSVKKTA